MGTLPFCFFSRAHVCGHLRTTLYIFTRKDDVGDVCCSSRSICDDDLKRDGVYALLNPSKQTVLLTLLTDAVADSLRDMVVYSAYLAYHAAMGERIPFGIGAERLLVLTERTACLGRRNGNFETWGCSRLLRRSSGVPFLATEPIN